MRISYQHMAFFAPFYRQFIDILTDILLEKIAVILYRILSHEMKIQSHQ